MIFSKFPINLEVTVRNSSRCVYEVIEIRLGATRAE